MGYVLGFSVGDIGQILDRPGLVTKAMATALVVFAISITAEWTLICFPLICSLIGCSL